MYQGVVPAPERSFVKELKSFDNTLNVKFQRDLERFVITKHRAYGRDWAILVVEDEFGGFRQPDRRDIRQLFFGDLWRHGGVKERVRTGEERAKAHEEKQTKDADDDIRALTRENKIQLSNTYRKTFNYGSKTPEFRRVDVRNPGARTLGEIKAARAAGRDPWAKAA